VLIYIKEKGVFACQGYKMQQLGQLKKHRFLGQ